MAIDPAAPTNQFLKVVGSRTTSKNGHQIVTQHTEVRFFQMTSDGETIKTKVVDFEKLYNFVVDNFFI
jgi:hypothetical protein